MIHHKSLNTKTHLKNGGKSLSIYTKQPSIPTWRKSYSDLHVGTKIHQDCLPRHYAFERGMALQCFSSGGWCGNAWRVERVVQGWTLCGVKFFWSWNLRGHIFFFGTAGHFWVRSESHHLFSIPTSHVAWRIGKRLDFHWEWLRMHLWHLCKGGNLSSKPSKLLPVKKGCFEQEPFATKKINCFPIPQLKINLKLAKSRWIPIYIYTLSILDLETLVDVRYYYITLRIMASQKLGGSAWRVPKNPANKQSQTPISQLI